MIKLPQLIKIHFGCACVHLSLAYARQTGQVVEPKSITYPNDKRFIGKHLIPAVVP